MHGNATGKQKRDLRRAMLTTSFTMLQQSAPGRACARRGGGGPRISRIRHSGPGGAKLVADQYAGEAPSRSTPKKAAHHLIRFTSMASQAFSASANVLKGDPPTLTAVLLKLMGRQEATKPGFPWSPGPLLLSLLITNEKPRSLALHISKSPVAGPTRPKCMGAFHDPASQSGPRFSGWGRQPVGRFSSGPRALGHRPEATIRRLAVPGVPAIATFSG